MHRAHDPMVRIPLHTYPQDGGAGLELLLDGLRLRLARHRTD